MLDGSYVFRCPGSRALFRQVVNASALWHKSINKLTTKSVRGIAKARQGNPIFSFGFLKFCGQCGGLFQSCCHFPQTDIGRFPDSAEPTFLWAWRILRRTKTFQSSLQLCDS